MANNVNCKEMRFVIRNLVDVHDVSPTMAPEIGELSGDNLDLILPATAPGIPFNVCLNYIGISPNRKG